MKDVLYSDRPYWSDIGKYILDCCAANSASDYCVFLERGEPRGFTYGQMLDAVKRVGSYLSEAVGKGGHVALLGGKSVEWIAAYCGCLCYGVVVSPLDTALPREETARQFCFSDSTVLLYDPACAKTAEHIRAQCPEAVCLPLRAGDGVESVASVISGGAPAAEPPVRGENDLAEIIFTSGTTGVGKGVMLSVGNIAAAVMFGIRAVNYASDESLLSILPNNHSFELAVGLLTPMYFGVSIVLCTSFRALKENFRVFRPSLLLVVPSLMALFRKEILREIRKQGAEKKFQRSLRLSRACRYVGVDLRRRLFRDIPAYFGGDLKALICGGAYLSEELISFFEDVGIPVIQGYGITECAPIVACNTDRCRVKLGVVSPYCQVKLEDGEICVSGKNVMLGYYKDSDQTAKVLRDGWFHTGDVGTLDKHGCLSLKGRKDNLIVNSNGENVSPEVIENRLTGNELIAECVVFSEDDLIAASIYPNLRLAEAQGVGDVEQAVREAVDAVNKTLPHKLRVERVHIRKEPFEKTSTMKVKRGNL